MMAGCFLFLFRMGPVYLFGFYLLFLVLNAVLLRGLKPVTPMGTRRPAVSESVASPSASAARRVHHAAADMNEASSPYEHLSDEAAPARSMDVVVPLRGLGVHRSESFRSSALPFAPATLSWRDVNYTVDIPPQQRGDKATQRQLLFNISGFAAPGRMTALMGSSGAGQTQSNEKFLSKSTLILLAARAHGKP